MVQGMSMSWVVIAAMSAMLVQGVMSKKLIVGDETGWTFPLPSPDFYSSWASKQIIAVDDVLVFKFDDQRHTVFQLTTKDAYEKCDSKLDPNAKQYKSTEEVTLAKDGTYYFICTIGTHCLGGQKLSVTVPSSTATTPATPTPNTPSSPDAPPTSPGNGSPLGISAFPVSFLAIVTSFVVLAKVIT